MCCRFILGGETGGAKLILDDNLRWEGVPAEQRRDSKRCSAVPGHLPFAHELISASYVITSGVSRCDCIDLKDCNARSGCWHSRMH